MPSPGRLLVIASLLALCAWLGVELNEQLNASPAVSGAPAPKAAKGPDVRLAAPSGQAFSMPAMAALAEMVDRPLFFEGRKRPVDDAPVAGVTVPESKPANKVVLTGIVISPDEKVALVKSLGTKEAVSLTVGQRIDSWKLEEIRADRILIRWGDQVEEVKIEDNKAPPMAGRAGANPRNAAVRNRLTPEQLRRAGARNRASGTPGRTTR